MGKLEGKTALITGASGGVGKQIAIRYAKEGANLAICARTQSKLLETAAQCEANGAKVIAVPTDIKDYAALKHLVEKTIETFGTIDILVNDAISICEPHPFLEHTIEELDNTMFSGLYGTWHLMKLCFPYLKEHGGSIINFGSGAGREGLAGYAAYASTKEAICGLSRVVAREWGVYNIRVNVLSPSAMTETVKGSLPLLSEEMRTYVIDSLSQNALHRPGDAYEDVAPVAVFLASDDSRWITGQNICAEGGGDIHC